MAKGPLIYRQRVLTRLTHWVWAVCLFFLLLTGLQIFNAYPSLHIGLESGFEYDNAILEIGARQKGEELQGFTRVFGREFDTTGVLGVQGEVIQAIPAALTIPSNRSLATGRVIHFFFAWSMVSPASVAARAAIGPTGAMSGMPEYEASFLRLVSVFLPSLRLWSAAGVREITHPTLNGRAAAWLPPKKLTKKCWPKILAKCQTPSLPPDWPRQSTAFPSRPAEYSPSMPCRNLARGVGKRHSPSPSKGPPAWFRGFFGRWPPFACRR